MNPFSEKTGKILMIIGIILFCFGLFFFLWKDINIRSLDKIDAAKFGQFGDFVGGLIGSLWSFAGVVLFYVALTEQRDDIRINREVLKTQVKALEQQIKEFELQREELELTRDVFIDQSTTLKLQQFESTYFNSMNLLNNIVQSITYVVPRQIIPSFNQPDLGKIYHGRDSFEFYYNDLKSEYKKLFRDYVVENIRQTNTSAESFNVSALKKEEIAKSAYENLYKQQHSDLGHYFRTIYNIVKLINDRKPNSPKYYTNLLRSQLSTYEHLLLFYNCHSIFGVEKFKPLIIEYSMLDNIAISELLDSEHKDFYPEEAFK